jgi:hypothetical protein
MGDGRHNLLCISFNSSLSIEGGDGRLGGSAEFGCGCGRSDGGVLIINRKLSSDAGSLGM